MFSEFSQTPKTSWKQQAIKDLKGKDFAETLTWHTPEGFDLEPYYESTELDPDITGQIQQAQRQTIGWLNLHTLTYQTDVTSNKAAVNHVQSGADGLLFDFGSDTLVEVRYEQLLHGLRLSETPVFFKTSRVGALLSGINRAIPYQKKGGWLSHTANITQMAEAIQLTHDSPQFRTVEVSLSAFQEAGANVSQQLAFGLANGVAYADQLTDLGMDKNVVFQKIFFSTTISANYFFEIAKLRALRYLWHRIKTIWNAEVPNDTFIYAQTSVFFDNETSVHDQLIQATTEAMSAVLGGCDALSVRASGHEAFAARIARNVSLILKEESYFDKTADPAAGSYYIEVLTQKLINSAWDLFLQIEDLGGALVAAEQGFFEAHIKQNGISTKA